MIWENSSQRKCKACRCTHLEPYGWELHLRMAIRVSNEMLSAMISSQPKREGKHFVRLIINITHWTSVCQTRHLKAAIVKKNEINKISWKSLRPSGKGSNNELTSTGTLLSHRDRSIEKGRKSLQLFKKISMWKSHNLSISHSSGSHWTEGEEWVKDTRVGTGRREGTDGTGTMTTAGLAKTTGGLSSTNCEGVCSLCHSNEKGLALG